MKSTIEDLYAYLKDEYGVKGTEVFNKHDSIPKSVGVIIPGVRKNSEEHHWIVFLETGKGKELSLIIGEHWPSRNTSWSRYIEILDYQSSNESLPFLKIIQNITFEKDQDLDTLITFLNVFKDFFKTVS